MVGISISCVSAYLKICYIGRLHSLWICFLTQWHTEYAGELIMLISGCNNLCNG